MLKELHIALEQRGFLVTLKDNHIYFSTGNFSSDLPALEGMLKEIGIDVYVEDRMIYLKKEITEAQFKQILWNRTINGGGAGTSFRGWRYFICRNHGPKISTFALDTGIALFVKAVSAAGIATILSCDGHGKRKPIIAFHGKYNEAWFDVYFQVIKNELNLNYEWKMDATDRVDVDFRAIRKTNGWDCEKVLEDTYKIAQYFLKAAEYLSTVKKEIFTGNRKSTGKLVKQMSYDKLYKWMEDKYKKYTMVLTGN